MESAWMQHDVDTKADYSLVQCINLEVYAEFLQYVNTLANFRLHRHNHYSSFDKKKNPKIMVHYMLDLY